MKITSPAFKEQGIIPSKYTCEGEEITPPLQWSNVPKNTVSLVLIIEDPDVPKSLRPDGMYDHWILFNILPNVQKIEEDKPPLCKSGMTTAGHNNYVGPCPPDREHRYFFKLFALDTMLNLPSGATKKEVQKAMQGHMIAEAQLIGLYEKGKGY